MLYHRVLLLASCLTWPVLAVVVLVVIYFLEQRLQNHDDNAYY